MESNWAPFIDKMANAFMKWKACGSEAPPPEDLCDASGTEVLCVIDLYGLRRSILLARYLASESSAEDIVLNGFVGNSPIEPSLAISIPTLELYRRLRMRQASFSIQSFVKVICDLYGVSTDSIPNIHPELTTSYSIHIGDVIEFSLVTHLMYTFSFFGRSTTSLQLPWAATVQTGGSSRAVQPVATR